MSYEYKVREQCEICGSKDKKPTSKYCRPCSNMAKEEFAKITKGAWKKAIEIVKNLKENNINVT